MDFSLQQAGLYFSAHSAEIARLIASDSKAAHDLASIMDALTQINENGKVLRRALKDIHFVTNLPDNQPLRFYSARYVGGRVQVQHLARDATPDQWLDADFLIVSACDYTGCCYYPTDNANVTIVRNVYIKFTDQTREPVLLTFDSGSEYRLSDGFSVSCCFRLTHTVTMSIGSQLH
eukprot:TRINITY_DN14292_c0_g1_i1.p1 TRINITY_DN14292_c0_g1~~TRINITY_DN14292_c0_g1_i1.p1  ORF type:complete len:177 (+),score=20.08 TRINITY_DN14292_c0_g1_i1:42-572(+)